MKILCLNKIEIELNEKDSLIEKKNDEVNKLTNILEMVYKSEQKRL